jgi:hypothetical protein
MPDHVHVVMMRHELKIEDIIQRMMSCATRQMTIAGLHPMEQYRDVKGRAPSPWAEGGWSVFLDSPEEIHGRIRYVNDNPLKAGLRAQRWRFVTRYVQ